MIPTKCPYCGSDEISHDRGQYPPYSCRLCGMVFTAKSVEIEEIRQEMFRILSAYDYEATHDDPLQIHVPVDNRPGHSLVVTGAYEENNIIWFTLSNFEQDDEFDNFDTKYLRKILEAMQNA